MGVLVVGDEEVVVLFLLDDLYNIVFIFVIISLVSNKLDIKVVVISI